MRYAILPNPEPPGRISLRLLVEAGSLMETDEQQGLAHFLEHMAFNGTTHFAADEMVAYFQRLGMAFGADTNAHTGFDETVYKLELPNHSVLPDGLLLLRDYLDRMDLAPDQIEKERGIILAEKRARDSVEYRSFLAELEFLLPGTLPTRRMPIGLEEVISGAQRDLFASFYGDWYTPDRSVLLAVGAVDPDALAKEFARFFGDLQARTRREDPPLGKVERRALETSIFRHPEMPSTTVSVQSVQPLEETTDSLARRRQAILQDLALAVMNRRLEVLSRRDGAAFLSGVAYSSEWLGFVRNSALELTVTDPARWKEALSIAEQELRRSLLHGFTEAELREAGSRLRNQFEEAAAREPTLRSRQVADALTRAVRQRRVFTSARQELDWVTQILAGLDAEEVEASWRRLWPEGMRLIFLSGQFAEGDPTEGAVLRAWEEAAAVPVDPPEASGESEFAYGASEEAGEVLWRDMVEDLGIWRIGFANNLVLQIKATPFESGVIHLAARFGAGELKLKPSEAGLPLLASASFIEGGLGRHDYDTVQRLMAGKSVDLSLAVSPDAFILRGQTSPRDLRSQLELMAAYLQDPGFRPEALGVAREKVRRFYAQLQFTPQGVLRNEVARYLAQGDHRFGYPPLTQVEAFSMEDLKSWMSEPLATDQIVLSVVGDCDPEEVVHWVARTLGSLPTRLGERPDGREFRTVRFPDLSGDPVRFTVSSEIPKAFVVHYWPTADMWDISRTRRLSTLAEVLNDRLRIHLREELGEAYSPFAFSFASDTYEQWGYLAAVVVADPDQIERVREALNQVDRDLAAGSVTEDERERAMKPLLEGLREWVRNNNYWLNSVLLQAHEYPQRLQWARAMQADIESIRTAEINDLAIRFLGPQRAHRVIILPAP